MDVDDVDGKLAQALGCLGTVDHETLIQQFQQLVGNGQQLAPETCAFFLDMNNWNLQAAVGSFYDYGNSTASGGQNQMPEMTFIRDITIGEGESVTPNTRFTKTWRLQNSGSSQWPYGCWLRYVEGDMLAMSREIMVGPLGPGEQTDVSVDMMSPDRAGIFQSRWQLNRQDGQPFGEPIWCIIVVEDSGLLGITQQLAGVSTHTTPVKHYSTQSYSGSPCAPLDESTSAIRGSPAQMSQSDYDMPASPNGSTALHSHVQQQFMMFPSSSTCAPTASTSATSLPVAISHNHQQQHIDDDDEQLPSDIGAQKRSQYNHNQDASNVDMDQSQQQTTPHHRRQPVVPPSTPSTPPTLMAHFTGSASSALNNPTSNTTNLSSTSTTNVCVVTPTPSAIPRFGHGQLM